jgi:hypothetical protein
MSNRTASHISRVDVARRQTPHMFKHPVASLALLDVLHAAVGQSLFEAFNLCDCTCLAFGHVDRFLRQLIDARVLENAAEAKKGMHDFSGGAYRLADTPTVADDLDEFLRQLSTKTLAEPEAIYGLWLDYAVATCADYIDTLSLLHRVPVPDDETLCNVLRSLAAVHSISTIRSISMVSVKTPGMLKMSGAAGCDLANVVNHILSQDAGAAAIRPLPVQRLAGHQDQLGNWFSKWFRIDDSIRGTDAFSLIMQRSSN